MTSLMRDSAACSDGFGEELASIDIGAYQLLSKPINFEMRLSVLAFAIDFLRFLLDTFESQLWPFVAGPREGKVNLRSDVSNRTDPSIERADTGRRVAMPTFVEL